MAVNNNADDYAAGRQNIFFTANNNTPADGNLTGQCVTLLKWFFAEMCDGFPSPFAARGDARYVGKTLVSQGLAVEVPYEQLRRGDIICYEYGTYGHIGVVLSGNRTFEENVNWPGVPSKIVDGATVYASRIGDLAESWRHDQHIYRINSYSEEEDMGISNSELALLTSSILNRQPTEGDNGYLGRSWQDVATEFYNSGEHKAIIAQYDKAGELQAQLDAIKDPVQLEKGVIYQA